MKVAAEALAAAAHRLGDHRDRVLARLGGPLGQAARDAATALVGDSRRQRAEWAARARAPVPAGLRGVHATWIEAALAELPSSARDAIAGSAAGADNASAGGADNAGAGGADNASAGGADNASAGGADNAAGVDLAAAVSVWLARWATAGFPPLDPPRPGPPRTPAELAQLAPDDAARWLASIGLDQLALALTGPWSETAARTLGADFPAAKARIARPPRAGALGSQRAALERCAGLVPFGAGDRVVIGARTVAPFVAGPIRAALALRMPKPLGERVLAALVDFARADPSRGPAWSVLVLP